MQELFSFRAVSVLFYMVFLRCGMSDLLTCNVTQYYPELLADVVVKPSDEKVYSVAVWPNDNTITICGENFDTSWEISDLLFNMVMQDIDMSFSSSNQIELKPRNIWTTTGELILFGLKIDGKFVPVNLKVATIHPWPQFDMQNDIFSVSQSHLLTIRGSGFIEIEPIQVELIPTSPNAFVVHSVTSNGVTLRLLPNQRWISGHIGTYGTIQLNRINFGLGWIRPGWSFLGSVWEDFEGITCDDSCELAYNGVCDDITVDQSHLKQLRFNGSEFCPASTDCTDCGGVRAILAALYPNEPESEGCTNTCYWAFDGVCNSNWCWGTDCHDCGPLPKSGDESNGDHHKKKFTVPEWLYWSIPFLVLGVFAVCVLLVSTYGIPAAESTNENSDGIEMTEYSELSQSDYDLEAALQQSRNEFEQGREEEVEGDEGRNGEVNTNSTPEEEEREDLIQAYVMEEATQRLHGDHEHHALPELVPVECEFDENRPPQADCELADVSQVTTVVAHAELAAENLD